MSLAILLRLTDEGEPLRRYFEGIIITRNPYWHKTISDITAYFLAAQFKDETSCSSATKESVKHIARRFYSERFTLDKGMLSMMTELTWRKAKTIIQSGQGAPQQESPYGSEEEARGDGHEESEGPRLPGQEG